MRHVSVAPLRNYYEVAPLKVPVLAKSANECIEFALGRWRGAEEAYPPYLTSLLRVRRERPSSSRATDKRDEIAPPHGRSSCGPGTP
jgi:hypothetical protein